MKTEENPRQDDGLSWGARGWFLTNWLISHGKDTEHEFGMSQLIKMRETIRAKGYKLSNMTQEITAYCEKILLEEYKGILDVEENKRSNSKDIK